jgi:predicted RNase H-like HicB family nuclease
MTAVRLEPAKEGGYVVTCRDLPEVVTQGDDFEEALAQASDALDEAFAARIDDGEDFPEPSPPRKGEYIVAPSSDLSAKAALYLAMKEAAISKVALARTLQVGGSLGRYMRRRGRCYRSAQLAQGFTLCRYGCQFKRSPGSCHSIAPRCPSCDRVTYAVRSSGPPKQRLVTPISGTG